MLIFLLLNNEEKSYTTLSVLICSSLWPCAELTVTCGGSCPFSIAVIFWQGALLCRGCVLLALSHRTLPPPSSSKPIWVCKAKHHEKLFAFLYSSAPNWICKVKSCRERNHHVTLLPSTITVCDQLLEWKADQLYRTLTPLWATLWRELPFPQQYTFVS